MRDLKTIIHGDLILQYLREYKLAHDAEPAPDQLASFKGRSADSKRGTISRLRATTRAREAAETPMYKITQAEHRKLVSDNRDLRAANQRLLARLETATDTIYRIREVIR